MLGGAAITITGLFASSKSQVFLQPNDGFGKKLIRFQVTAFTV
jgi:hypothetical protein